MLLMVMEMRMGNWTDFVGVISVCFNVQLPPNLMLRYTNFYYVNGFYFRCVSSLLSWTLVTMKKDSTEYARL